MSVSPVVDDLVVKRRKLRVQDEDLPVACSLVRVQEEGLLFAEMVGRIGVAHVHLDRRILLPGEADRRDGNVYDRVQESRINLQVVRLGDQLRRFDAGRTLRAVNTLETNRV